jgi:hypothetical protein
MTKRKQDIVQAATLLFAHLYDLPETTTTQFEKIENLIALHFDIVKKMPHEIYLAVKN